LAVVEVQAITVAAAVQAVAFIIKPELLFLE
jgi:hypothetical protein